MQKDKSTAPTSTLRFIGTLANIEQSLSLSLRFHHVVFVGPHSQRTRPTAVIVFVEMMTRGPPSTTPLLSKTGNFLCYSTIAFASSAAWLLWLCNAYTCFISSPQITLSLCNASWQCICLSLSLSLLSERVMCFVTLETFILFFNCLLF